MENNDFENNISMFREMIRCGNDINLWCFDDSANLLETNCPYKELFLNFMKFFGFQDILRQYSAEHSAPIWLATPLGISWMTVLYKPEGHLQRIYMIGPVASTEISLRTIRETILSMPKLTLNMQQQNNIETALRNVPVCSSMVMDKLCLMMHYLVTSERLQTSDFSFQREQVIINESRVAPRDRHRTWIAEQNLMRMIREGDLNYKDALKQTRELSSGVPLRVGDPVRQAKDSVIVSISLCVRAAIQGGLSPETAYSIGDRYIQSVEEAKNPADVGAINNAMFEDFVLRVHRCRNDPNVSSNIRRCCDYIETHTEDELSIAFLAEMVGYTPYYLSRKFKEELHVGINDYIKIARIERAKFLLSTFDISVHEVAARLHFCTPSHFGTTFRKLTGCSPKEFQDTYEAKTN